MTACNHCSAPMIPDETALVPALRCVACGRVIPCTGAPRVRATKQDEKAVLRAARRRKMKEGRL